MICVLLMLNVSMFSTLAWMTDTSELVNTFTVGKVDIDLNETDVDEDGNTKENEYRLIPGSELKKDPTVTVMAGSEETYIRMFLHIYNASAVRKIVTNSEHGLNTFIDLLGDLDTDSWKFEKITQDKSKNTVSYEFRYKTTVSGLDDTGNPLQKDLDLEPLFQKLLVPETLTMAELETLEKGGFKMVVEAHAIQQLGFKDADEAWAAFEEEYEEGATNAQ